MTQDPAPQVDTENTAHSSRMSVREPKARVTNDMRQGAGAGDSSITSEDSMSVDPLKSNALPLDRVPEGTVSPERMREVLRRLDQDYYSGAEIQDKVAHAVLQELGLS